MGVIEYRGRRVQVPDDASDAELDNLLTQFDTDIDAEDRQERVTTAAGQLYQDSRVQDDDMGGLGGVYNDARNWASDVPYVGGVSEAVLGTEQRPSMLNTLANEFMRNFLVDAPANIKGAVDPNYAGTENAGEQRDAYRQATDMLTESSGLNKGLDGLASLFGALKSPTVKVPGAAVRAQRGTGVGKSAGRVGTATGGGALEGAVAGALESEKQDLAGVLEEAFMTSMLGGAVGGGVQAGSEVIGRGFQDAYGDAETPQRLRTQRDAGLPISMGSVGNENAAMLENTLRDAPLSIARMAPGVPNVKQKQTERNDAIDALFEQHRQKVSSQPPLTKGSDFNAAARGAIGDTRAGIRSEIQETGDALVDAVGADTPVKIRQVEEVPDKLGREFRGQGVIARAQSDVDDLSRERPRGGPVNTELNRVLGARFRTLEKKRKTLETDIENNLKRQEELRAKGRARQADRLQTRLSAPEGLRKQLGDVKQQIKVTQGRARDNLGAPFKAVQDWRSEIGAQGDKATGLRSYEKDVLYAPGTRAMEGASDDFKPLNDKLRKAYGDDAVLGQYFRANTNPATKIPKLFMDGNKDIIDVMDRRMDPGDWGQLRASVIHNMGMTTNKGSQEFSDVAFLSKWDKLGDEMKTKLAGAPETRALYDSLAEVTRSLTNLRKEQNVSRSGVSGGILASLAVNSMTAAKFFARVGVADAAVASEALADAVAGNPNKLNEVLRNSAILSQTRGEE